MRIMTHNYLKLTHRILKLTHRILKLLAAAQLMSALYANDSFAAVQIPSGLYPMGEILDGSLYVHKVFIDAFVIDQYPVTYSDYLDTIKWATNNGYSAFKGTGKAGDHPVVNVTWYDAVRYCNARSERDNLKPAYWLTQNRVYRTGNLNPIVNYSAAGYRLPTEAEYEKASKGGLTGYRFPWGDNIDQSKANYFGLTYYSYDKGPNGFNPRYNTGKQPYTSPIGSFPSNGYEISDMCGNINEWTGDWYSSSYYRVSPLYNPTGPTTGSQKIERGGSWNDYATGCRCADRSLHNSPSHPSAIVGFRCVRIALTQ